MKFSVNIREEGNYETRIRFEEDRGEWKSLYPWDNLLKGRVIILSTLERDFCSLWYWG